MNEKIEKEFNEKFAQVFKWIQLNCKDEIIAGVDINHLPETLRTFIDTHFIAIKDATSYGDIHEARADAYISKKDLEEAIENMWKCYCGGGFKKKKNIFHISECRLNNRVVWKALQDLKDKLL